MKEGMLVPSCHIERLGVTFIPLGTLIKSDPTQEGVLVSSEEVLNNSDGDWYGNADSIVAVYIKLLRPTRHRSGCGGGLYSLVFWDEVTSVKLSSLVLEENTDEDAPPEGEW